jgi:hypothetical protein
VAGRRVRAHNYIYVIKDLLCMASPYNVSGSDRPQGLRHELILAEDSQKLLCKLEQDCETEESKRFFQTTLNNWVMHNLMHCIKIDANTCPELFHIFENAIKLLAKVCDAELKGDLTLTRDFENSELWLTRDANASACSMALPGQRASVLLSHEMVNLMMQGKWDDEDHKAQLTGVILHELTHILYKHCQYITSMKKLLAITQDGSEIGIRIAGDNCRLAHRTSRLRVDGRQRLVRRVETDLQEIPTPIKDIFTKMAGGNIGVPLSSKAFFAQLLDVPRNFVDIIEEVVMMSDPHLPVLCRLEQLECHRKQLQVRACTRTVHFV